jgi:KUP system potassium uptake protein
MLMICTVALVTGFRSSSKLAAAYGVAVTSTMIITSILFYVVARNRWQWSLHKALSISVLFLLVDIPFFIANISKIMHGAWFPLVIGASFFMLMLTWAKGRDILATALRRMTPPVHQYIVDLSGMPLNNIDGDAVFLSGKRNAVPVALAKNIKHNKSVHNRTILLHFRPEDVPRVPNLEKIQTEKLGGGFHRIIARYGFMEDPQLDTVLALARGIGLDLDPLKTSFFIGRENLVISDEPAMARWRANLFIFMSRNAADAISFFNLPPEQVIEVGVRLAI